MILHSKLQIFWIVIFLMQYPVEIAAQDFSGNSNDLSQIRLIKIRRMSEAWINRPVELKSRSGKTVAGNFLPMRDGMFRLNISGKVNEIPVVDIHSVVLKRRSQDLLLVGILGLVAGALFAGIGSLGFDAEGSKLIVFAALGIGAGFSFGWQSFYKNRVIRLK